MATPRTHQVSGRDSLELTPRAGRPTRAAVGHALRQLAGAWVPHLGIALTGISYLLAGVLAFKLLTDGAGPATGTGKVPGFDAPSDIAFVNTIVPAILATVDRTVLVAAIGASYLFLPGVAAALLALPIALSWRRPARFLVLRRFARDDASRGLGALLLRYVCPSGHVYTPADRDITIPC